MRKAAVLKGAIYSSLAMVTVVLTVGVASIAHLRGVKAELVNARREAASLRERVSRLEQQIRLAAERQPSSAMPSDERALPFELTSAETQAVRVYIKVPPSPPGTPATVSQGDLLPTGTLLPLPPQVEDQVPKLKGARFTSDQNGAIILVRRGSRRADAIIAPR